MSYVGRFAPSPTGPLHFGSLVTALASYRDARAAGGKWLVRIEDLDGPRTAKGAAADILRTLERFRFEWDGEVIYQSTRAEAYEEALEKLKPHLAITGQKYTLDDFTVKRSDGIFAYQLAVVVDDAFQGVTDIVRGDDLLDSTPRQIRLQQLLGLPTPKYKHIPVVRNEQGQKLSKQTLAPPLDPNRVDELLQQAADYLNLHSPRHVL
ncbi:MAG TPA: glutamate--tRNA ligase family protein [Bryobacteraceae bacterium]|nr:glutamate--tRNA ligase family protein [Bryobacteraceae bacterium]